MARAHYLVYRRATSTSAIKAIAKSQHYPTLSKTATKKIVVEDLNFTQLKAFQLLIQYDVKIQLALDMVAKVQSSEIIGFQDWYFEEVIQIFDC